MGFPFVWIIVSFLQKLLSVSRSHVLIFVFISITLEDELKKKILLQFMSESVLPMFSSKSFIVSGLTFRSLAHLNLFLCMVVRSVLISYFH